MSTVNRAALIALVLLAVLIAPTASIDLAQEHGPATD